MEEDYGLKALIGNILHKGIGHGNPASKAPYKPIERAIAAFEMTRPILTIMGIALIATGAVLAIGTIPPILKIIYGIICAFLANCYIHTFNDFSDRERDKQVWPNRALPTKRISPQNALILSLCYFILAVGLTAIFFNITTGMIILISLSLGTLYTVFLRDRVGYLVLPFIVGIHPLGGWAAFSPHTLFKNPLPWILYALIFFWQAGHIMIHSTLHPVKEVNGRRITQVKGLFFTTTPRQAATLGFIFLFMTFCISIYLYFVAPLGYIYIVVAILSAIYALIPSIRLIKEPENIQRALRAFNAASLYSLILCFFVLVDVLVYKVLWEYLVSFHNLLRFNIGLWMFPLIIAGIATIFGFAFLGIFVLDAITKWFMKRRQFSLNNR